VVAVCSSVAAHLRRTGRVRVDGPVRLYPASDTIGGSATTADDAATTWLLTHGEFTPGG
jgi:hypothetical protein